MRYLRRHWRLLIVLLIYVVIATAHSLMVPLTTGNDEWAHFLYLRFIAEHDRLPATPVERDEAGYKSDAPPLYHLVVAGLTSGVEPTRLLRFLDTPRRELADNVINPYALVHTGVELPPYRGEVLTWYLGRGVSIVFGVVLIVVTYLSSLAIFPDGQRALLAAALLAFTPAFVFHSSVLSYESLSALFAALFLWVSIKAIKEPGRWIWWPILGVLAGLSITTKYSAILLPVELVLVAWLVFRLARQQSDLSSRRKSASVRFRRHFLVPLVTAGVALLLAASWWFGFVVWNFNEVEVHGPVVGVLEPLLVGDASDTTSVSVGKFLFGQDAVTAEQRPLLERNLGQIGQLLLNSFWAAPVAGQFLLSPWLALFFGLLALFALVSLGRVWQKNEGLDRTWLILLLFHTLLVAPLLIVRMLLSFDPREVAQGRHLLLPAASAIPLLLVWGWSQWRYKISQFVIVGLLLWSVFGQVGWAAVVYPAPIPVWPAKTLATNMTSIRPIEATLADTMRLTDFAWRERPDQSSLEVTLWWQALAEMSEDYLVELALIDQQGDIVSYGISHPVQGRYPTRAWEAGDVVRDVHWLPLAGPLAGDYQLRLRILDRAGHPLPEEPSVSLGHVSVTVSTRQLDPCIVWFQGQSAWGDLQARSYRLRAPLTVIASVMPVLKPTSDQPDQTEQMPLVSVGNFHVFVVGPDWAETYQLAVGSTLCRQLSFEVPPRNFSPPELANPLAVNFNDEVQLLGYDLPTRRIHPGGRLPLTLYWQALTYMGEDYQIFDNLLDLQQRRWGGYDRRARDGYSTLRWVPGEVITDAFGVPVDPAAPPGIYTLDVGLYRQTEDGAESLPLVVEGQPMAQTSIRLGPVKVGGPPPDVIASNPMPQTTLKQSLGDQITLVGYDVTDQNGQSISAPPSPDAPISNLNLTLYWQADTSPAVDYTAFVHLRDASNQTVAQQDALPANGQYPTSLWESGEVIADEISLSATDLPPGQYRLVVGLYDLATGQRLAVPGNPANEINLETIELP